MPFQINPNDYGFRNLSDLAVLAGTLQGEVRPNGNLQNRAMIADVLFNRANDPAFAYRNSYSENGVSYSGAAAQARNPNEFSTWRPAESYAYQNATGMQSLIQRLGRDPAAWDTLTPAQQNNIALNLTALRGVFGQYDPNGSTAGYTPQGGALQGVSGGATFYSNPRAIAASHVAEHVRQGMNQGIDSGGNVFYGGSPARSAAGAQAARNFDWNAATTSLAAGDDVEGDAGAEGAGMLARMATNYGNLPEASNVNRYDPFAYGGINGDPARYALNPRPDYDPGLSALDRFSDTITQGLQGAFGSIADAYNQKLGRVITPEEMKTRLDEINNGGPDLGRQLQEIAASPEAAAFNASGRTSAYASLPTFGSYSDPYATVGDFLGIMSGPGGLTNGSFSDPSVAGSQAFTKDNLVNAAAHEWLNRDFSAEDRGYWTDRIGQPGSVLSDVLAQIAASPEASHMRGVFGTDASTAGSVPAYTPNTGTAVGTDASRGGAYSYDPYLGVTAIGSDASTGGANSYGRFIDPYSFSGTQIGTAGNLGMGAPIDLGAIANRISSSSLDTSLPSLSSLSPVSTSGYRMDGQTDAANAGRYGDAAVPTLSPTPLPSFDPYTAANLDTSVPGLPQLSPVPTSNPFSTSGLDTSLPSTPDLSPIPTQVGPYSFATNRQGLVDLSSLTDPTLRAVAKGYGDELGRAPDASGLASWAQQLTNGMSGSQFYGALANSAEGQARTASGATLPTFTANLNPYAFGMGLGVGTANGIGNPTPDGLGDYGPITSAGINPSVPAYTPLSPVSTAGLGMDGTTDSANSARYGDSAVPTPAPDALPSFGPVTADPLPSLSPTPDLATPSTNVGPMAFGHIAPGLVNGLYEQNLGRSGDPTGLDYYNRELASGQMSLGDIASALHSSTEGQAFSAANPGAYHFAPGNLENLYAYALGRGVDQSGLDFYNSELDGGQSTYTVLGQLLNSQEGMAYQTAQGRSADDVQGEIGRLKAADQSLGSGQPNLSAQYGDNLNDLLGGAAYGSAWLTPSAVSQRSAQWQRLLANDAANAANNSFITNSNAFNAAQSNNLSLASVPGAVHGDATGAGAALNNISQQLANERLAIAQLPVAPTAAPIQSSFYGQQPTANSRSLFGTGLPPGAGFI